MTPNTGAIVLTAALAFPHATYAGPVSLLGNGFFGAADPARVETDYEEPAEVARTAFIPVSREVPPAMPGRSGSSLFAGASQGFFAPLPPREIAPRRSYGLQDDGVLPPLPPNATYVERLRQIIGHAESRRDGYNAINYGAKRLPAKRPTDMTIGEIYAWIEATPGQPHAIGRYQFIPSTLKRLVRKIGASEQQRFSPDLQDRLGDQLLIEAGLIAFRDGLMPRTTFMNNLAKIWAGLPNSSGRSHYHGYAGNQASMTWAHFDAEMAKVFPS